MSDTKRTNSARLYLEFFEAVKGTAIGGAAVLERLSDLASACITGTTAAQDAVAFALSTIFGQHAEDRDDRPVIGDDTYLLLASGYDCLSDAIKFVDEGGGADDPIRIIAALARLIRFPAD